MLGIFFAGVQYFLTGRLKSIGDTHHFVQVKSELRMCFHSPLAHNNNFVGPVVGQPREDFYNPPRKASSNSIPIDCCSDAPDHPFSSRQILYRTRNKRTMGHPSMKNLWFHDPQRPS